MRNLIIISAPSGSGKTTICKEIQKKDPQIKFSISHTSRSMRSNEEDGVDYFFIDHLKFEVEFWSPETIWMIKVPERKRRWEYAKLALQNSDIAFDPLDLFEDD